ncbi:DNA-3-methyladenine glycosylase 2 family protein [Candidatus Microgenomates bacterium]|nr:DNA-3-methyladenine glycosylase 2 family protein [Candidatus Microgenomates bacterium]
MWNDAEKFLRKDNHIAPLIKEWGKCTIKPIRKSIYFEDLVEAIINQQLSGKAASTIFGRVKKLLKRIEPSSIMKIKDQKLRDAGLSWQKVSYVKDLASRVEKKELKLSLLNKLDDGEVIEELTKVKGIGNWTAEMFLMFGLARPDVFPIDDLGIKKGFEKVTKREWDKVGSPKFAEKHWKPYRTIASWYLWRSLDNR